MPLVDFFSLNVHRYRWFPITVSVLWISARHPIR